MKSLASLYFHNVKCYLQISAEMFSLLASDNNHSRKLLREHFDWYGKMELAASASRSSGIVIVIGEKI